MNRQDAPECADAELMLITPAEGQVTGPLQLFPPMPETCGHEIHEGQDARGWQEVAGKASSLAGEDPRLAGEDRSLPKPVTFAWQAPAGEPGLRYDLTVRAEDGSGETCVLRDLTLAGAEVENLRVGTHYTWWVQARAGGRIVARSKVGQFRTHPAPPRWIHAEGLTNVRDLGGWALPGGHRVRQGMFFRGAEMNSHCQITPAGKALLVEQLGIRTDIDLRGAGEECQAVLDPQRVTYINIPLYSYDMIALPEHSRRFRALFGLFAQPERYPLYIHCWAGADRTGTASFLVGALLGMSTADLVMEYELTSLSVWGERRGDGEPFREMLKILEVFAPKDSSLQTQVERYLHVMGVSAEEVASIRALLTGE